MQTNIKKNVQKILTELGQLNKLSKAILKYGFRVFISLLVIGTVIFIFNQTKQNPDLQIISTGLIKYSFTILAEGVIGALVMDYVFKK
ncbi:MAG: hypothetical protein N2645_23150 [Clostridia bacterium]|nr:hypothetical protein [Clostridia bacterium]